MSEPARPHAIEQAGWPGQEALSPQVIETALAEFRSWLEQMGGAQQASPAEPEPQPIDLHTLLAQFIGLRQEVNLQTRAARSQQEQNSTVLEELRRAVEIVRKTQDSEAELHDKAIRPLLQAMVAVHDALALATDEVERVSALLDVEQPADMNEESVEAGDEDEEAMTAAGTDTLSELGGESPVPSENVPESIVDGPDTGGHESLMSKRPSLWSRLFGGGGDPAADQSQRIRDLERQLTAAQALTAKKTALERDVEQLKIQLAQSHRRATLALAEAERVRSLVGAVAHGYRMSMQRLERTMAQAGLEQMDCAGKTFDPEQMEVVAVVSDAARPPNQVVQEIRHGYLWRGRVFRFAQVSVARS